MSGKPKKTGISRQAITANRLADGRVVYVDAGGAWVTDFARAQTLDAGDEERWLARARADEVAGVVVNPYAIALAEGSEPVPATLRELIRARGPTVETQAADREGPPDDAHV